MNIILHVPSSSNAPCMHRYRHSRCIVLRESDAFLLQQSSNLVVGKQHRSSSLQRQGPTRNQPTNQSILIIIVIRCLCTLIHGAEIELANVFIDATYHMCLHVGFRNYGIASIDRLDAGHSLVSQLSSMRTHLRKLDVSMRLRNAIEELCTKQ